MTSNIVKLFILFYFSSFNLFAGNDFKLADNIAYDDKIKNEIENNRYKIDWSRTSTSEVIINNKDYIILFNPIEFSYEAMRRQANKICKNQVNYFYEIGVYSAYFPCNENEIFSSEEFILSIKENNYDTLIDLEIKTTKERRRRKIEIEKINEIEEDKRNHERKNNYELIIKNIEISNLILEKRISLGLKIKKIIIQNNIDTCKKYNFDEGTDIFNQCLIILINRN